MKSKWTVFKDIVSWVVLIAMVILLGFTTVNAIKAQKTGESNFLFGYRPVLVLTGSMEPYMMTNSIALTKEVTDMDQLEVGDVVTYHMTTDAGRLIRITHRILAIEDGFIYTRGDNNHVADGYALTMDNIEAEVVAVFNQTAWLAAKWQTTAGKVMIISFTVFFICLCVALDLWWSAKVSKRREARQAAALEAQAAAGNAEVESDATASAETAEAPSEPVEAVSDAAAAAEISEAPIESGEAQSETPDAQS